MKRITIVRALAALAVVIALATVITKSRHAVPAVYAASGCSNAALNSNYGFIQPAGFTTHNAPTGNEVPWQFVGVETFDGKGNTIVRYTAAVDGAISQNQASAGTYNVNSNCTGSLAFTEGDAAGLTFDIAISGGGADVFAISTNSGNTATVIEKKQ